MKQEIIPKLEKIIVYSTLSVFITIIIFGFTYIDVITSNYPNEWYRGREVLLKGSISLFILGILLLFLLVCLSLYKKVIDISENMEAQQKSRFFGGCYTAIFGVTLAIVGVGSIGLYLLKNMNTSLDMLLMMGGAVILGIGASIFFIGISRIAHNR
jgi:hypothetical protein